MGLKSAAIETFVRTSGFILPRRMLRSLYGRAVGNTSVALCMHRVGTPGPLAPLPWISVTQAELDELIDMVAPHHLRNGSALTLTFDDGYRDAVEYVTLRAPQYAHVDWVLFVCPEKSRVRAGYRWDLHEMERRAGSSVEFETLMSDPLQLGSENQRAELRALGDHDDFELATVDALLSAAQLPNVRIGNHTNNHFKLAELSDEDAEQEIRCSARALDELVGGHTDFAFPFGTPASSFGHREVELVRSCYPSLTMWSTEGRCYGPEDHTNGAVLPRIAHFGDWPPKRMLAFMTYCAASRRVRLALRRRR